MKKILKIAGVLLIAVAMVMSTVAVTADTVNENAVCLTSEPTNIAQPEIETFGRAILWDQYDTDGSNGLSHMDPTSTGTGLTRYLLDDFEIPAGDTWILTDLHSLNVWNTMQPGVGTGFVLDFWSDAGGSPGALIATAVTVSYTETATGRMWFTRQEFEIEYIYEPITLTGGIYWIHGHVVGPENCFWMARAEALIWGSECWLDYSDQVPPLKPGSAVNVDPYDLAFQLTGEIEQPCEPSIDVEKYVWDPELEEWIDADTADDALDLEICTDVSFKIVIHNDGECDLYNIIVKDWMHDSLKFLSADPEPHFFEYNPPEYYMEWVFPGPLHPCNTIEIYITAHVDGPDCSRDYNRVKVEGTAEEHPGEPVTDEDEAWVHAFEKSRTVNRPFLNWLQNHLDMFPMLRLLLQRFGL